jgi:hypothetical protein
LYDAVARVDLLEPRRLLTSTLDANGLLTATGTSGDDDLRLDLRNGFIRVTLNGTLDGAFDVNAVTAIVMNGGDGNDTVRIGPNIIGGTINGDAGNDTRRLPRRRARMATTCWTAGMGMTRWMGRWARIC